jgi:serine/threonine-protein kinase
MKSRILPLTALVVSQAGLILTLLYASRRLPPRIASHFDAAGVPDGWMARDAYLWTMSAAGLGISIFILAAFYAARYFPPAVINLPNKEYWLAPERSADTHEAFFRAGVWLASLVATLELAVHLLVVAANNSAPPKLSSHIWLLTAGFLLAILAWAVAFTRRFSRTR